MNPVLSDANGTLLSTIKAVAEMAATATSLSMFNMPGK